MPDNDRNDDKKNQRSSLDNSRVNHIELLTDKVNHRVTFREINVDKSFLLNKLTEISNYLKILSCCASKPIIIHWL